MPLRVRFFLFVISCLTLFLCGCSEVSNQKSDQISSNPVVASGSGSYQVHGGPTALLEGFESGSKGSYTAADVTLGSGVWNLNDALIGSLATDVKNGNQSARVRNSGKITMQFNKTNGAGTVTVLHAKYGSDAGSTWQLWYSTNSGGTWQQTGGSVSTTSTTLQTATFTVNLPGTIRFEIRKTDGTSSRMNIDDITFDEYIPDNPMPGLTSIYPLWMNAGVPDFTLYVTGSNFIASSVVKWNGTSLTTTYVSATELQAVVNSALVASAGNANVTVFTPLPGGGTTSSQGFMILAASGNVNTTMGNPSAAVRDVNYPANYLIERPQYVLSYSRDRGIANWVSWQLNSTWITGSAVDNDQFKTDNSLPTGWYRVKTGDYTNSGFSRGHMCASADRKSTQADMDSVYLMTNIVPQTQAMNGSAWENLETYCRNLCTQGSVLYIISGTYGTGGTGLNGYKTTLASGKLTVPAKLWKVIMVLPAGTNDLSRVTTSTRTIAVVMDNNLGPFSAWGNYRVSVDSVESLTGYDFFSNVPKPTQAVIESVVDNQ